MLCHSLSAQNVVDIMLCNHALLKWIYSANPFLITKFAKISLLSLPSNPLPQSPFCSVSSPLYQADTVKSLVSANDIWLVKETKSSTPSNLRSDGSQEVLFPCQPLCPLVGKEILFSVPLLLFEVKSVHVIFVSVSSAKFPPLSMFVPSKLSTRLFKISPPDELELLLDELLELLLDEDELEELLLLEDDELTGGNIIPLLLEELDEELLELLDDEELLELVPPHTFAVGWNLLNSKR